MVVPALPYAVGEIFHIPSENTQTWVTILLAVYGIANVLASPGFGYVADRGNTRRYSFVVALIVMMASMIIFSISTSRLLLVVARGFQGIAAAGVWVVSLAIVVDTVEQEHVGSAMGHISLAMTSGNVLGPMLGGILYSIGCLKVITITALSIIAMTIIARLIMIEVQSLQRLMARGNFEQPNHDTLSNQSSSNASVKDGMRNTNGSTVICPSSTGPKTPWALLTSKHFLVILWSICATSAFYSAFDTILPLQTMRAFHWTPAGSGLIFLPLSAPTLFSPWLGGLVDKFGTRFIALIGFTAALPFFVALAFIKDGTFGHEILMCVALFGVGSCLICQMVPLMTEVSKVVDRKDIPSGGRTLRSTVATGYALFNVAYAAGILLGALVGGFVCEVAGWMVTNLVLGAISFAVAVPLYLAEEIGLPPDEAEECLLGHEHSRSGGYLTLNPGNN